MKKDFIIKRCNSCGALVEIIDDCSCENCGIKCCGQEMSIVKENSTDCASEKHLPTYEVVGNYIIVNVGHVMENDHYIEWIAISSQNLTAKKFLEPIHKATAIFPYIKGSKIYSYCNKHGLWSTQVE